MREFVKLRQKMCNYVKYDDCANMKAKDTKKCKKT